MRRCGAIFCTTRAAFLGLLCIFLVEARPFVTESASKDSLSEWHWRGLLQGKKPEVQQNIAGGADAPCGRFPYIASLRTMQGEHKCGGVLIAPQWVLSAAHCLDGNSSLNPHLIIVVGACNLDDKQGTKDSGQTVEIFRNREIFIHNNWTGAVEFGFDIALVRLDGISVNTPVIFSDPVALRNGQRVTAIGWGQTEDGGNAKGLQHTNKLNIIENKYCDDKDDGWGNMILDSSICAFGFGEGADTCPGDNGGPLLMAYQPGGRVENGYPNLDTVVGITSFVQQVGCGKSDLPGVYTRVSSFVQWIETTIMESMAPSPVKTLEPFPPSPPADDITLLGSQEFSAPSTSSSAADGHQGCVCSVDGMSGDTETGSGGCHRRLPTGILLCYLASGQDCQPAFASALFPGAIWAPCTTDGGLQELQQTISEEDGEEAEVNKELVAIASSSNANVTQVRDLIFEGADPNYRWRGTTPVLHIAASTGAAAVVSAIIEAGATISALDEFGMTALHVAAAFGHVNAVEFLVEAGVDPKSRDINRRTPYSDICTYLANCSSDTMTQIGSLLLKT